MNGKFWLDVQYRQKWQVESAVDVQIRLGTFASANLSKQPQGKIGLLLGLLDDQLFAQGLLSLKEESISKASHQLPTIQGVLEIDLDFTVNSIRQLLSNGPFGEWKPACWRQSTSNLVSKVCERAQTSLLSLCSGIMRQTDALSGKQWLDVMVKLIFLVRLPCQLLLKWNWSTSELWSTIKDHYISWLCM